MPGPSGSLGAGVANCAEGWAQICRLTCAILDGGEVRERQPRSNWPVSMLLWRCSPASHCGNEKTLFLKRYFQFGQLLFIFSSYPLWGQIVAIRITTEVYESLDWPYFYPLPVCLWIALIHLDLPCYNTLPHPYLLALVSSGWSITLVNMFTVILLPPLKNWLFFIFSLHLCFISQSLLTRVLNWWTLWSRCDWELLPDSARPSYGKSIPVSSVQIHQTRQEHRLIS